MKNKTALVEESLKMQEDLNDLSVDKINEMAPIIETVPQEMSLKTRAEMEGARYIEPDRSLKAIGKLPESLKKEHAHDWEYVKGIFENNIVIGEPISFWICKYPGDKDTKWTIPCNQPIYVPRMIAKHLETNLAYHTFTYKEKAAHEQKEDDFMHNFVASNTHYRGKFRPVSAFG